MFTKFDKAIVGSIGGALAILVVWALQTFYNIEMGEQESIALGIVFAGVLGGLVWLIPNKS